LWLTVSVGSELKISEADLRQWDLLGSFRERLRECSQKGLHSSWSDARRRVQYADYLSLFLFGLLNPALKTMQSLCSASQLKRVQREVCGGAVSLGSFSEAQHLTEAALLERVFQDLTQQVQGPAPSDPRVAWQQWFARDSSLLAALPRMSWALYGGGRGGSSRAVRLHLNLQLLEDKPALMQVTAGKICERKAWKEIWEPGAAYVGDRYFGESYGLLLELKEKGCSYVIRLRDEAIIQVEEELPLSAEDQAAGAVRQAWAILGARQGSGRLRVVWIAMAQGGTLQLATNLSPEQMPAALVGMLYRRRWQIECFFRWVKCLLGCRHWLAESQQGVTVQLYLALIAAVLLQLCMGRRPNKRMMELFQLYQLGWASLEELLTGLQRQQAREQRRKIKKN
jgi:hypothetical protein